MKRPPIVYVLWLDAHGLGATEDISPDEVDERLHKGWPTHTSGILLRSDERGVSIAADVQEPDPTDENAKPNYRGTHHIPRGMIVREVLVSGRPRKKKGAVDGES